MAPMTLSDLLVKLPMTVLCAFLFPELSGGIGNLDVELFSAFDDELSGPGGNVVSDLGTILLVVHEEHLELLGVVNHKLVKSVGEEVASLLVRAEANCGLGNSALKAPPHARVDTLLLSPARAGNTQKAIRLVPCKRLRALLHNLLLYNRGNLGHFVSA